MPRIWLETVVPATIEECFERSLSVDAHQASMEGSGERAIAGVTYGVMGPGDTVTWRARHFGLVFRMTSAITEHDSPVRFVDEQVSGPFAVWRHEHRFAEVDDGTLMMDDVEMASPLGLVGRAVDALLLERYMTRLQQQRNEWLAASFRDG